MRRLRLRLRLPLISAYTAPPAHAGMNEVAALPVSRGFDTHLGYLSGAEDYYAHIPGDASPPAYDFVIGAAAPSGSQPSLVPAVQYNGSYSTTVLTAAAVELIANTPVDGQRLFLYLAFQNVHWPLQAPQAYIDGCANRTGGNAQRQAVCAMACILDEAIGNVTAALAAAGFDDSNTLIVFTSDNGGPENGDEGTESNNYPLRGGKNTLWQGGVRVDGVVAGTGIQLPAGSSLTESVHATDWLPTLVSMASGANWTTFIPPTEPPYQLGDGMDVWSSLSTGAPSPRDYILLETHPANASDGDRVHGDGLIVGQWKLLRWGPTMPQVENGWFPPPGQDPANTTYTVNCGGPPPSKVDPNACGGSSWCLFDIDADPCEYNDVSAQHPDIVDQLKARLATFQATAVPPLVPTGCNSVPVRVYPSQALAWWPCDLPPPPPPPVLALQADGSGVAV